MSIDIDITAGAVDAVTAVATAAAALVAAWAVISANRTARRAREHQRLAERYDAAVALLSAFEEIQEIREWADPMFHSDEEYAAILKRNAENETLQLARARCVALLRASEEPLPITRGAFFNHTGLPFTDDPEQAEKMLEGAPQLGNPEAEMPDVMRTRGEIVATIDGLRGRLSN
jgi:hypothetical protein